MSGFNRKINNHIRNPPFQGLHTRPGAVLSQGGEYSWVSSRVGSALPSNAVFAGNDSDGSQIYVGRAKHEFDLLPAKVIPNKRAAYVSFGGREIVKDRYEVLCGTGFTWISSCNGNVPPSAIEGGKTSSNEVLYIGRANHAGSLTPGKVHKSHNCFYFPYNGLEHRANSYEVLVQRPNVRWTRSSNRSTVPPGAFHCGHDSDGTPMYIGRANHQGDQIPAKVLPSKQCAYISYGGAEILKNQFDVLCGGNPSWQQSSNGQVPSNAIPGGRTGTGEILYIGRVSHAGSLTVGKVHPSHGSLYIAYGGREFPFKNYEILIQH